MSILSGILSGADIAITEKIDRPDRATPKEKARRTPRCIVLNKVSRAKKELGLTKLPEVVQKFGNFMLQQSARTITPRDVVKAYTITRSSIQRSAQPPETLRSSWADHPFTGEKIRPEDAFAVLLGTVDGKLYLDDAAAGRMSRAGFLAARRIVMKLVTFGTAKTLYKDMTQRAPALAVKTEALAKALREGSKAEWYQFAKDNIWGIGPAKKGFIASLLGRGDIPTADAREIAFWWVNRDKFTRKQQETRMDKFADRLEQRLAALDIETPPELRPFYQHLAHHAVWDAVGGTQTTHQDVISCMMLAGL